jgi:arginyl-tRNA synthetase
MILYLKHTISVIANKYEVNKMTIYLTSLAKTFHSYYANTKILDKDNINLSMERLYLAKAVQQVIHNGLSLLGINVVDKM